MTEPRPERPSAAGSLIAWGAVALVVGAAGAGAVYFAGQKQADSDAEAAAEAAVAVDAEVAATAEEESAGIWIDPNQPGRVGKGRPLTDDSGLLAKSPGRLPDHLCVERSGKEVRTTELLDRFLVVDFIFTNCPGTCIPMAERMHELQEATKGVDDLRLVSFTVDPRRDSPQKLAEYADRVGADKDRWWFLFTQKGRVHHIAYEGLKLGSAKDPVVHSQKFVLLDRTGNVRAYYDPLDDAKWMPKLLRDLETLRKEPH